MKPEWWGPIRSFGVLAGIGVVVAVTPSRSPVVTALALAGVVAGWATWTVPGVPARWLVAGLLLAGFSGLALWYVNPRSAAFAFPAIVCIRAGVCLPPRLSIGIAVTLCAVLMAGIPLTGGHRWWLILGPAILLASLAGGMIRRQQVRLQTEAEAARTEQAALAERARIAREIHDVLAHTLAALTVQLETADALLEGGRPGPARDLVVRAGQLAREGLAETRRAIGALRGEALPLPDLLTALLAGYRADLGGTAILTVDGEARDLAPETGLTLYRAAQEALTNIRKHAPGAPVELALTYAPEAVDLAVVNGPGDSGELAGAGGGYGFTGLRERAELAGGEFSAGPRDGGWRVGVRIPT
jgi:signal transduction histidine kinase